MLQNLQQERGVFWIIPSALILNLFFDIGGWSAIGLVFSIFYLFQVIRKMGHTIPIIELMTALAALQWIVGPFIDYHNNINHYKYYMYISEGLYMSYVVPAVIAFRIGTLFFRDNADLHIIGLRVKYLLNNTPKLPYILIMIGLIVPLLYSILPPSLLFVFFLLSNIKYVGAIYLLFSDKTNRWLIFL